MISIQRSGAIGDVIMALPIAQKLAVESVPVEWRSDELCRQPLSGLSCISCLRSPGGTGPHIQLDGAYEGLDRQARSAISIPTIFMQKAMPALSKKGVKLSHPFSNLTPKLKLNAEDRAIMKPLLAPFTRHKTIAVIPRSNSFAVRTVHESSWFEFARAIGDSVACFWTGTDPAPKGFTDLKIRELRQLMALLASVDLVVSVDTGPMHLAAAVGTPMICIVQSCDPFLHLPEQADWSPYYPPLGCLNCHHSACPIDNKTPPCSLPPGAELAEAALRRLNSKQRISAVIATLRPNVERLKECLTAALPQVDEIIVAIDGDGAIPSGLPQNSKIRYIQNPFKSRRGWGKMCNLGVRHSIGGFVLILNDDAVINPGYVASLKRTLQLDANNAVVSGLLWYPDGSIQHGGKFRGDSGYGHVDHTMREPSVKQIKEMECVTFAAAMIRRSAFYDVNGLDERYDCYCEDDDMCLRLRQRGWRVIFDPSAQAIHAESQTTGESKIAMISRSSVTFQSLWMPYFIRNKTNTGLGVFA